jgi:hypothetical protein
MSDLLFGALPEQRKPVSNKKCGGCTHIEKWEYGSGRCVFYCGITKSNRTGNGLLKIKRKSEACGLFVTKYKGGEV